MAGVTPPKGDIQGEARRGPVAATAPWMLFPWERIAWPELKNSAASPPPPIPAGPHQVAGSSLCPYRVPSQQDPSRRRCLLFPYLTTRGRCSIKNRAAAGL